MLEVVGQRDKIVNVRMSNADSGNSWIHASRIECLADQKSKKLEWRVRGD